MWNDPIVEEVRRHRDELARQCDYDLDRLGRYFRDRQRHHGKVVSRPPKAPEPWEKADVGNASEVVRHAKEK